MLLPRGMSTTKGSWYLVAALVLCGCAHKQAPLEPAAKQAVNETRGICPTDLNQSEVVVDKRSDGYALVFRTRDDSQRFALHDRAIRLAKAMAEPHPAIDKQGELVMHTAAGSAEVLEAPMNPDVGYGVEIVFHVPADRSDALRADLDDHLRMWRNGECPELRDPSLRAQVKGPKEDR
jgi:hypothetical protein